jgi:hypothetical protein
MPKQLLVALVLLAVAGLGWFVRTRAMAAEKRAAQQALLEGRAAEQAKLKEMDAQERERRRAAAEATSKAAAELEAARNAVPADQRRARWVQEYVVSAAGIDPAIRELTTALLTRAAAEGRGVPYKFEATNAVSDRALKDALDGFDIAATCKLEQRSTTAGVDLVAGEVATEGVKVRVAWLDGKESIDAQVTENGEPQMVQLRLGATRVAIDLRAPNAQPIHKEQDVTIDANDFASRLPKTGSLAEAQAALASTMNGAACLLAASMLGLRDP